MTAINTQTKSASEKDARAPEQTRNVPSYTPAVDIYETDTDVFVAADMPGVDDKHVEVNLENNVLTLTGHSTPDTAEGYTLLRRGYVAGDYIRSFNLSEDVDREGIKAQMKNGVLRIRLPKAKEKQPRRITVESA
ncbi:MAG TPA: Hsp20/alpha crystallin family protein [Kiritimatiellia bacterium]|nr:Hsp20/alpha crystallin family protein [Kiritimatiellia bacterium]